MVSPNRMNLTTFVVFLLFFIVPPVVHADQLVLVFNVSMVMDTQCGAAGKNGLDSAKIRALALLNEDLTINPQLKISIVDFAGTTAATRIYSSSNRRKLKKILKGLTVDTAEQGSTAMGMRMAMDLLEKDGDHSPAEQEIIIFTNEQENGQGLLSLLGTTVQRGISIHFHLFNGQIEGKMEGEQSTAEQKITVSSFGCPGHLLLTGYEQKILFTVRQKTAEQLGMLLKDINMDSDLITDLGADTYESYEILAMLCSEHEVPLPENRNLTNIGQISRHIISQKKKRTRGEGPSLSESYKKTVYYATDRNVTGNPDPDGYYGIKRSENSELSYGVCTVSIPESHQIGQIENPFLGLDFFESTEDHFVLLSITPLHKNEMYARLGMKLNNEQTDPTADDIMIFVHGFNHSFEKVAKRTAQIAVDLDFRGVPFMFSWPSNNSLFDYWPDREDVAWSVAHLEELLMDLSKQFPDKGLHLIAHSMGNQALVGALNRIALQLGHLEIPLFKNIILAAPDFDARLFQEQIAPEVVSLAANWSIYASENDTALTYSGDINEAKRLGIPLTTLDGMNVIDASGVEVTPWSVPEFHSYFATKMVVIRDMTKSLKGLVPSKRSLIPQPGSPFLWLLKLPERINRPTKKMIEDEGDTR